MISLSSPYLSPWARTPNCGARFCIAHLLNLRSLAVVTLATRQLLCRLSLLHEPMTLQQSCLSPIPALVRALRPFLWNPAVQLECIIINAQTDNNHSVCGCVLTQLSKVISIMSVFYGSFVNSLYKQGGIKCQQTYT